jgi:hypothetical protein
MVLQEQCKQFGGNLILLQAFKYSLFFGTHQCRTKDDANWCIATQYDRYQNGAGQQQAQTELKRLHIRQVVRIHLVVCSMVHNGSE